ncbi:MAG: hypothetical protein J5814_03010 [Bacteroidaceae bacterium]|nr:hypothetical protein [Bacteroidaceae bacterium]
MKKEKRFFPSRAREILSSYFSEHEFLEFNEFFYGVSPKRSRKSYKNRFENLSKIYLRHDTPSFSSFAFHVFPACHRSCKPGIVLLERTSFVWTKAENESLSRRRLRTDCLLPDCYLPAEEFFHVLLMSSRLPCLHSARLSFVKPSEPMDGRHTAGQSQACMSSAVQEADRTKYDKRQTGYVVYDFLYRFL